MRRVPGNDDPAGGWRPAPSPEPRQYSERQQQLYFLLIGVVRGQASDPLRRLLDEDVAEATAALAATYETVARGLIYEHQPQTLPAQRLVTELRTVLQPLAERAGERVIEREAPRALRAIERGARETARTLRTDSRTAYLELVGRVLAPARSGLSDEAPETGTPGLILPG